MLNQTTLHYLKSDKNHTKNLIEIIPLFIKGTLQFFRHDIFMQMHIIITIHTCASHVCNAISLKIGTFPVSWICFRCRVYFELLRNCREELEDGVYLFLSRFDVCGFGRPVYRSYYDLSGAIYWRVRVTLLRNKGKYYTINCR